MQSITVYESDPTLAQLQEIKTLPQRNAIGFEWAKIADGKVRGVNIYRKDHREQKHIATVSNPYATHFVDTRVTPDTDYVYVFKTLRFGKEAAMGTEVRVRSLPPLRSVAFLQAYPLDQRAVKLLWTPHVNESISGYLIERSVDDGAWRYMAQVNGRIMVEYIDTYVRPGRKYSYRIISKSYDETLSQPSKPVSIRL